MRDRKFMILSTASLPLERIPHIPGSIDLRVDPFIEIIARSDEKIKKQITQLAKEKSTVVFTSAHAVRIVAAMLENKPDWSIYCVRNETRVAAESYFGILSLKKFADNALLLSREIINDRIREAVFFCGDQRMDILPDNLKKHGIQLTEHVVYDTLLTPKQLDIHPDAILFFSPTAVRSFFSLNALPEETTIFAMGTSTANALRENTAHPVIISAESDKAFVLNMAMQYAASHP